MITKEFIDKNSFKTEQISEYKIIRQLYDLADIYNICEEKSDRLATTLSFESSEVYSYVLELQECLDDVLAKIKLISQNSFSPLAQLSVNALVVALGEIESFCYMLEDIEKNGTSNLDDCTLGYTLYTVSCLLDNKKSDDTLTMTREEFLALDEDTDSLLSFEDFIVRTNVFHCDKNHSVETITATVNILKRDGVIVTENLSAGYCKECNIYFILERDYLRLKKSGVVLCQLITYEVYTNSKSTNINSLDLKPESLLHRCGYNVSSTENLSQEQRRGILRRVIDCGLYSVSGLCSYLDWLIDRNSRSSTRDMSNAISKWTSDRDYIASYKTDNARLVGIKSLRSKNKT